MDHGTFDRLTAALGGASTRRTSLKAAIGALFGAAVTGASARKRGDGRPQPEGPCGNGKRKANLCTKDKECCTGHCDTSKGKQNKDGKGRCRFLKAGMTCKPGQQCAPKLDCLDGTCQRPVSCKPNVCPACAVTTVQAAIDAAEAGDTIFIGAGTYDEDLTIEKTLTLEACPGQTVTLRNATTNTRTIMLPTSEPSTVAEFITLNLTNITVTSSRDVQADEPGGGIYGFGNVTLNGSTSITGNRAEDNGDTYSAHGGGLSLCPAGYPDPPGCTLTLNDTSSITSNEATEGGGGVNLNAGCTVVLNDASSVSGNVAEDGRGGGIYCYENCTITLSGSSTIRSNEAKTVNSSSGDGGGIGTYGPMAISLADAASITLNKAAGSGGGIYSVTTGTVTMSGSSAITNNTPDQCLGVTC
jgi:predicted outer membrane repeat protein